MQTLIISGSGFWVAPTTTIFKSICIGQIRIRKPKTEEKQNSRVANTHFVGQVANCNSNGVDCRQRINCNYSICCVDHGVIDYRLDYNFNSKNWDIRCFFIVLDLNFMRFELVSGKRIVECYWNQGWETFLFSIDKNYLTPSNLINYSLWSKRLEHIQEL